MTWKYCRKLKINLSVVKTKAEFSGQPLVGAVIDFYAAKARFCVTGSEIYINLFPPLLPVCRLIKDFLLHTPSAASCRLSHMRIFAISSFPSTVVKFNNKLVERCIKDSVGDPFKRGSFSASTRIAINLFRQICPAQPNWRRRKTRP